MKTMVQVMVQLNDSQEWKITLSNDQFMSITTNVNQTQIEKDVYVDFLSIELFRQKLFMCPMKEIKAMTTTFSSEGDIRKAELYQRLKNKVEGTK